MKVQGLIGSMIGLVAGCGVTGTTEDPSGLQVDRIEMASDGLPYFISGELGRAAAPIDDLSRAPEALASVLPAIANALGVPAADLIAKRTERDELGMTHVRFAQQKNGLRVVGGDAIVHLDAAGTVRSVNSTVRDADLPSAPSIAAEKAAEAAVAATAEPADAKRGELTYLVSNSDGELYLAWEVEVRGRDSMLVHDLVYVDALSGRVIERHPQVFTIKNRVIRNGNGGEFPVANAPIIGTETQAPTDPVALAAHTNTGITYDCYKALYNRDSYNNQGATLTSQVHVKFGGSGNNAVWSSADQMMAYGDGDGIQMKELAYSMDVTAHELTHAVTSATANLVYLNESGALNEGMSDIFGAVCELWKTDKELAATPPAATWLVGEDIWTPNVAGDALRYMADPVKDRVGTSEFYSRDFYADRYTGTQDGGGVHLNSGLPNLTFYLMSVGGKHPRGKAATVTVPGIGIKKSGAIFQRALTTYMTQNTNMAAARTATESAAQDLYPGTCAKTATSLAWSAIGVGTAPTDATAPATAITSPAEGAKVTAGFQVQATATDNLCVNKVELIVDGTVVETLTAGPYNFSATATNNLTKGSHTIEVKTYDAFQASSARATVNVTGGGTGGGGGNGDGDGDVNDGTDVTGGCSTGGNGAAGSLAMMFAAVFALRRRRARR